MMPKSADYKQGYGKGYNTGRGQASVQANEYHDSLLLVAQRAERAETASGVGHCDECSNWNRPSPTYAWGYCDASVQPGSPWGCWMQGPSINDRHDQGRISTTPKFGCVLFLRKENHPMTDKTKPASPVEPEQSEREQFNAAYSVIPGTTSTYDTAWLCWQAAIRAHLKETP